MDHILQELNTVPGIIGSLVFNEKQGIYKRQLPGIFKNAKLKHLGRSLVKMYSASRMSVEGVTEISLCYEEAVIVFRQIYEGNYLIVLSDPSANLNLMAMSLNLVMDELKGEIQQLEPVGEDEMPEEPSSADSTSGNRGYKADEMLTSGPMAPSLQAMQKSLAKVVGPIARVMFREALDDWVKTVPPSRGTLSVLVEFLRTEIDNPDQFEAYRSRIDSFIADKN